VGFGVAMLFLLALIMAYATKFEAETSTTMAQRYIYKSLWFDFLLGLFTLSLTLATLRLRPFRLHHLGLLITHLSILVIMLGAFVTHHWGYEGTVRLLEGEATTSMTTGNLSLQLLEGDSLLAEEVIPWVGKGVQEHLKKQLYWKQIPARLHLAGYYPDAVQEEKVDSTETGGPALQVRLFSEHFDVRHWLLPDYPGRSSRTLGEVLELVSHDFSTPEEWDSLMQVLERRDPGLSSEAVHLAPLDDGFRVAIVHAGEISTAFLGDSVLTLPWMDLRLEVSRYYPHSRLRRYATARSEHEQQPALLLVYEEKSQRDSLWLFYGVPEELTLAGKVYGLRFWQQERPLGFQVKLLDFREEKYPGSRRAASYSSLVEVNDPAAGPEWKDRRVLIYMNHPFTHGGLKFFQSSFERGGGEEVSVFSVSHDPGVWLIYLGSVTLTLGIIIVFYFKKMLLRWEKRRQRM
jgi:hypothetical protein